MHVFVSVEGETVKSVRVSVPVACKRIRWKIRVEFWNTVICE